VDVVVVARSRLVRSLLRRAVSKPEAGLRCRADYGRLPLDGVLCSGGEREWVIVDSEAYDEVKLGELLAKGRSRGCRFLMLVHKEGKPAAGGDVLLIPKPGLPAEWEKLCRDLPALLREGETVSIPEDRIDFLAVGASAGGPAAIVELLDILDEKLHEITVVMVQHIGAGFEESFLALLRRKFPGLDVGLAGDGEYAGKAALRLAPPDHHLLVDEGGCFRLDGKEPALNGHRPSIDLFFRSLCRRPRGVAGVLLSGMGRDGASGLMDLHRAGALTFVQDADSSIVYGMPRVALESGAAEFALNPAAIGNCLRTRIGVEP